MMQEQMTGSAMVPPDPKAAFKAEWEALEVCDHNWALKNVESDLLGSGKNSHPESNSSEAIYYQSKTES